MQENEILDDIKTILVEDFDYKQDHLNFTNEDEIETLGLDSFQMVELAYEIEKKMKIKINNEELTKLKKISDLLSTVQNKRSSNGKKV